MSNIFKSNKNTRSEKDQPMKEVQQLRHNERRPFSIFKASPATQKYIMNTITVISLNWLQGIQM